ncbi:hypothetical protein H5410_052750 [Solanum commersonii]|uniref:Uncharacterized protein n=1 Tax=Solanum commersonii TaxID=4109 RepID=A0A9J5X1Z1_SOLCO|nr:hypothetical protein H5410_052750 [Solanum commersonii]
MNSAICVMDASSCLGESSLFLDELECNDGDDMMKKLKIFQSDPFDYHSIIVDALKGCCALFYSFEPPRDHSTYDLWHALSKTVAEKTAWALAMDRMVSGLLMGPDLTVKNSYLKGAAEMYEDGSVCDR